MSVLVGAAKKAGHPPLPFSPDSTESNPNSNPSSSSSATAGEAGPSQDSILRQPSSRRDYGPESLSRQPSRHSVCELEDGDVENDDGIDDKSFVVSPIVPLKDQIDKDKDDESLRRWKEQLLGSVVLEGEEGGVEPEVRVQELRIVSAGRPDIVIALPLPQPSSSSSSSSKAPPLFTLKEGSSYQVKFTFTVRNNIVSGLKYIHTVWKSGFRVDNSKVMLGTFSPQSEPYIYITEEETTPSGLLARGTYTSRTKFVDDDGRCHLEIQHTFDIRKDW